ncbi:MAG TPA: hypothetical protein VLE47_01330 [Candidatus Saccharimonadales bacterium]|nr:hypothetical protein [Candidatus Saccharimonadales bacterium]
MEETNQQTTPKSPSKFNSHKVWATIGVILIGVIVVLGLLSFIYRNQLYDILFGSPDTSTTEVVKVATSSAKTATPSATTSATQ